MDAFERRSLFGPPVSAPAADYM